MTDPPHLGAEPAVMAGKLVRAGWERWPQGEHSAVRAAFFAAWVWTLGRDTDEQDAVRWLLGLAVLGDVTDALEAWLQSPSHHAVGHLASLVYDQRERLANAETVEGSFWENTVPGAREQVTAWLLGADVRRWLRTAAPPGGPFSRWLFDEACAVLPPDDPA